MVEYDPEEDGDARSDLDYLKPTKYVLGDATTDGHTHVFYLRDNLPIATTLGYSSVQDTNRNHAHSIEEGPGNTLIVEEADGHIHTNLVIEEEGDYTPLTLNS